MSIEKPEKPDDSRLTELMKQHTEERRREREEIPIRKIPYETTPKNEEELVSQVNENGDLPLDLIRNKPTNKEGHTEIRVTLADRSELEIARKKYFEDKKIKSKERENARNKDSKTALYDLLRYTSGRHYYISNDNLMRFYKKYGEDTDRTKVFLDKYIKYGKTLEDEDEKIRIKEWEELEKIEDEEEKDKKKKEILSARTKRRKEIDRKKHLFERTEGDPKKIKGPDRIKIPEERKEKAEPPKELPRKEERKEEIKENPKKEEKPEEVKERKVFIHGPEGDEIIDLNEQKKLEEDCKSCKKEECKKEEIIKISSTNENVFLDRFDELYLGGFFFDATGEFESPYIFSFKKGRTPRLVVDFVNQTLDLNVPIFNTNVDAYNPFNVFKKVVKRDEGKVKVSNIKKLEIIVYTVGKSEEKLIITYKNETREIKGVQKQVENISISLPNSYMTSNCFSKIIRENKNNFDTFYNKFMDYKINAVKMTDRKQTAERDENYKDKIEEKMLPGVDEKDVNDVQPEMVTMFSLNFDLDVIESRSKLKKINKKSFKDYYDSIDEEKKENEDYKYWVQDKKVYIDETTKRNTTKKYKFEINISTLIKNAKTENEEQMQCLQIKFDAGKDVNEFKKMFELLTNKITRVDINIDDTLKEDERRRLEEEKMSESGSGSESESSSYSDDELPKAEKKDQEEIEGEEKEAESLEERSEEKREELEVQVEEKPKEDEYSNKGEEIQHEEDVVNEVENIDNMNLDDLMNEI